MTCPVVTSPVADAPIERVMDACRGVRALFVLNSLSIGGSETKTVRVVNALLRRDLRVGVAYLNGPDQLLTAFDSGVPVWHLNRRGKFSPIALGALRGIIREQHPQVVLAMSLYPALYVSLATAGMRDRPRTVALINTTDLPNGREWQPAFYRRFLRRFDSTIYGCELQRLRWLNLLRNPQTHSDVIYNGVDTDCFTPAVDAVRIEERRRFDIAAQAFVIGSVGRLAPEKNQALLVDVVAELRRRSIDAHLLLVGEGGLRVELESRVAEQGMQPHVTFAGMQSDVRGALSAMDVFVLPSTHVETFSNAALEAMAMCKPVVLSRIGGAAEMVKEGVEGYTIECASLRQDLPPLLARLWENEELRQRMGRSARERVAQNFSLNSMVNRYAALLDKQPSCATQAAGR